MRKYALRFIPVLALVAAVTAGIIWMQSAGAASSASNTPPLMACGSCHSMEKEVSSWKTSEHAGVSCLECHQEGDVGWVSHEFADRNDDMASIAKAYTIHLKVPNERCTECHKSQMDSIMKDIVPKPIKAAVSSVPAGQPMPVKAAHELHVNGNPQLKCVDCHLPAVHGLQKGTVERQNLIHQQCQTCHQEKQVTFTVAGSFSCSACHTNAADVTPANHKNTALWQKDHGKASQDNTCGQCHLAETAGPKSTLSNTTAFKTSGEQDACLACHQGVTMPHEKDFLSVHGEQYLAAKAGTCEACHTPEKNPIKPTPEHATATYCTDCHLGQPMPHPAGYLSYHGTDAKSQTCDACHSPKNPAKSYAPHASSGYCSNCHDSYEHPTGWVASHGTNVGESCSTCHTLQGEQGQHNACSTCHTSSGTWHPNMWFAKHGRIVNESGDGQCLNCHNEVEPSCSQCHRNR